jgi:hypothetical protein
VRNHVKLASCNHRLKEPLVASTECVKVTGREEIHVCNTRLKELDESPGSRHTDTTTEGQGRPVAFLAAEEIVTDWRKRTDGHVMAKRLKEIEATEFELHRTGLRQTKHQEDWMQRLENAMREETEIPERPPPKYKASLYDSERINLEYEDFTSRASWNFGRNRRPVFKDYGSAAYAAQTPCDLPFIIQPEPICPALLDGRAYTRASPTFFRARINEAQNRPTAGLLDNCAAISLIDRRLINTLQPPPTLYHGEVHIKGIGSNVSKEFCVLPIFIDVTEKDESGVRRKRKVRILVEFHVIEDLNESFVLGMDVIGPYQIDIITSKAEARIKTAHDVAFAPDFGAGWPKSMKQESYNVVAAETITIAARCETTIPALIAGHGGTTTDKYDLFLEPIPIIEEGLDMIGMVGKGLYSSDATKVWFANLGSHPITIRKGTRIASASHVSSMDTISVLPIKHTAGGNGTAEIFSCVPKKQSDPGTLRKMRQTEPHWSQYVQEYAFPAILMEPTDRPPPDQETPEDDFDVSLDFGSAKQKILRDVLQANQEAFTMDGKPGLVSGLELELDTDDHKLYPERLRQTSPRKQIFIDETLDQLLEWDIISPSHSRVSYPVVIVHQNGKDRFCVDYRGLNRFTRPMVYPMQRSDEMFEALAGKKIFSSLDAARGYHQIPIHPDHRWKTAFITHRGLFEYNTMPFGLKTAPGIFQRFMDGILGRLRWTAALSYIDDVIIFSDTVEEHAQHIEYILRAAISAGLKFSPSKCHFGYASLKLLGRRVSTEGLEVLQDKLAAVRELRAPRTLKELWHVLGLFGYYRSFIHRYSIIAAPLIKLMRGIKPDRNQDGTYTHRMGATTIEWSSECQDAFDTLKEKLTNPPVLAYPDFMSSFILYVDASHAGMACALHQTSSRESYQTPLREPNLPSSRESSLRDPTSSREPNQFSSREPFKPPAREPNQSSTRESSHTASRESNEAVAAPMATDEKIGIAALQKADPTWRKIIDNVHMFEQFSLQDAVLHHKDAICLPNNKRFIASVLNDCHDANGHLGISKSYDVMRRQWYRPGMFNILRSYVNSCAVCKGTKLSRQPPAGELHPQRNVSPLAFDNIAMDIFPLPATQGFDACLTVVDTFTKTVVLRPTSTTATTADVADILFTSILCRGFLPSTVISDKDPKYTSELWDLVMKKLGTKISLTSPYHQQADPAERTIQTVETVLRCYKDMNWVLRFPYVEMVLNDTKNDSTGYSPNELLYVARRGPVIDAMLERYEEDEDFPEVLAQAKQKVREAFDNMKTAQGRQKIKYDARHRPPDDIHVGDLAFLLLDKHPVRGIKMTKLAWPKWGPLRVLAVTETTVDLEFPPTSKKAPTVSRQHIVRLPPDEFNRALPEAELIGGEDAYEVEAIIGERLFGKAKDRQFRIKWQHYPINEASWEPESRLRQDMDRETLERMIAEYRESNKDSNTKATARLRRDGTTANAMRAVEDAAKKTKIEDATKKTKERPILYLSRTLRSYERNYTILELELGAVVWSVLKLQRYLDGVPFTVVTDHQPILQVVSSNSKTLTSPRVERWRMLLQPYMGQMTFVHKAGKKHLNVDALSRLERDEGGGSEKDEGSGMRRRTIGRKDKAEKKEGKG